MGVVMYKVLLKVSRSCHSMHDLRSVARGRKVHSHNVPAVFSGFPNVRTRSFLSSCAVKKLTHLSPHCSTDTDTHIKKHSLTSGFGGDPTSLDNGHGLCRMDCYSSSSTLSLCCLYSFWIIFPAISCPGVGADF